MSRKHSKKKVDPPASTAVEPSPARRSTASELAESPFLRLNAHDAGSETSPHVSTRRRQLDKSNSCQSGGSVKVGGVRPRAPQPPQPPPPLQRVEWSAARTSTATGEAQDNHNSNSRSSGRSSAVRPSRVITGALLEPGNKHEAAVAALAGGRLPKVAEGEPFVAVPKGTAKPPGRVRKSQGRHGSSSSSGGKGLVGRLLARLRAAAFSLEEFTDFSSSNDSRGGVAAWQTRLAARLDAMKGLPSWAKQFAFDTIDFLSRRRVHLVLAVVVLALILAAGPSTADALTAMSGTFIVAEDDRPGLKFLEKFNNGSPELPAKHPVAIIPGFVTGALELWETKGTCLERQSTSFSTFRQRMFGPQMIFLLLTDANCWMELFSVNKTSGMDKDGIRVRADTGFTSVDFFMPGYWVWAKVLINLADIGYDPQSMAVMTYDWRLSPVHTHERDGFFYSVRNSIKFLCQKNRLRAVVISHSYGTTVALAFFKWEEQREPGFMNRYVAYYVNIGGTTMGIPKAASALLQGDVRDTMTIPKVARKVVDNFISQRSRYDTTRSWSCLYAMMPHGCRAAHPSLFSFPNGTEIDTAALMDVLVQECGSTNHTNCVTELRKYREEVDELPVLPQAPDTAVVCLYGVNKSSEVGYKLEDPEQRKHLAQDSVTGHHVGDGGSSLGYFLKKTTPPSAESDPQDVAVLQTNMSYSDADTYQGVRMGNGDGTVPLGSLAYMCRAPNGWRQNAGRVVTLEYRHDTANASPLNLRGGAISGDHVDILGNYDFLETILKIASGVDELGAKKGMDEIKWWEGQGTGSDSQTKKKRRKSKPTVLHRRLQDRILSNIDELIQTEYASCLAQPNNPIQPKPGKDDNEFL